MVSSSKNARGAFVEAPPFKLSIRLLGQHESHVERLTRLDRLAVLGPRGPARLRGPLGGRLVESRGAGALLDLRLTGDAPIGADAHVNGRSPLLAHATRGRRIVVIRRGGMLHIELGSDAHDLPG